MQEEILHHSSGNGHLGLLESGCANPDGIKSPLPGVFIRVAIEQSTANRARTSANEGEDNFATEGALQRRACSSRCNLSTTQASEINSSKVSARWSTGRRILVIGGCSLLAVLVIAIVVLVAKWPFTRAAVKEQLNELGEGTVEIGSFRPTYFPPGCVAENVVFHGNGPDGSKSPIVVKTMTVIGSYAGMFEFPKHIRQIRLDGVRVIEIPGGNLAKPSRSSDLVVDEIRAKQAELDIAPNGQRTERLRFLVPDLSMQHVVANKPFSFKAVVRMPVPPGDVNVSGTAGPWNDANPGQTPISGDFILANADLGAFKGIDGKLAAKGQFRGLLQHLEVTGATSMPQLIVKSSEHGLPLTAKFHAFVDGTNGDVTLAPVDAMLGESIIHWNGKIYKDGNDSGKTVALDFATESGRIQDLLYLFVHSKSPMTGLTNFNAKVRIDPKPGRFLEKVQLEGDFGIGGSKFTKPTTQKKVDTLSKRAQGNTKDDDPATVVSDLAGHVRLENGVATFSRLSLNVPGASARLHGTFNLESEKIDLHGMLRTDVKLSKATSGFQSFLLKVVEFMKQKKKEGAFVPVKITGTYAKPSFDVDAPAEK
jgi:hypothetical protein